MNFAKPEPRTWSRCGAALPADAPGATGIELSSADFSPPRSGPPKTAGGGLKSALLSSRNSLNSMAVLPSPLPVRASQGEGAGDFTYGGSIKLRPLRVCAAFNKVGAKEAVSIAAIPATGVSPN